MDNIIRAGQIGLLLNQILSNASPELRAVKREIVDGKIIFCCADEPQAQQMMRWTYRDLLRTSRHCVFPENIRLVVYGWEQDPDGVRYPLDV